MTIPFHVEMDIKCTSTSACENVLIGDGDTTAHVGWTLNLFDDGSTSCGSAACMKLEFDWHGSSNRATNDLVTTISKSSMGAGTSHHIKFDYDGNGCITGHISGYIDGVLGTQSLVAEDCNDASVAISKSPGIGIASTFWSANNSTFQNVATYTTQYPAGTEDDLACSSNCPLDPMAIFHGYEVQGNPALPAVPSPCNIVFEKDWSDSDDVWSMAALVWGHIHGTTNNCHVVGVIGNSINYCAASAFRALLDSSNLTTVPVGQFWGTTGGSSNFDNSCYLRTNWRSQDTTNVGITGETLASGSGYAVGDVVQLNPSLGTLATGATAPYFAVTAVTGSTPTALRSAWFSGRSLYSYSAAPSCSVGSPCAFNTITGTGSGLTATALTTTANKGNFVEGASLLCDLLTSYGHLIVINGGQSRVDYEADTTTCPSTFQNPAKLGLFEPMQNYMPSNAYWNPSSPLPLEFNQANVYTEWQTIYADLKTGGVPILYAGVENTNTVAGTNTGIPVTTQGWIVAGGDVTNHSISAWADANNSGCCTTQGIDIQSGNYVSATGVATINVRNGVPIPVGRNVTIASAGSTSGCASLAFMNGTFAAITGTTPTAILINVGTGHGNSSLGACGTATVANVYFRTFWDFPLILADQYGITPGSTGKAGWTMWQGNQGTLTISNTTPYSSWTQTTGDVSWVRRSTSPDNYIAWIDGIVAQFQASGINNRRGTAPGNRTGSRRSAANDNAHHFARHARRVAATN